MRSNQVPPDTFFEQAEALLSRDIAREEEVLAEYGHDATEDLVYQPYAVAFPVSTDEVSRLLALCSKYSVPVTARGAGTGLSGGALAVQGGVMLSFKYMNRIHYIDENNFQACVEPGVITGDLQRAVAEKGLYYPPDPASKDSCFIGGNVAENSGGPRAVKYGVTSDYILNMEAVLADGSVIHTGANTLKNATGYDLTGLLVGSEGTLAVVTKIYVRLIPHPKESVLLWIPYVNGEKACEEVARIFKAGFDPSALEFMERNAVEWSLNYSDVSLSLPDWAEAFLLIELDGNDKSYIMQEAELLFEMLDENAEGEILFAEDTRSRERLWKIRRNCAEGVHAQSVYKEEDTVVPRYELPRLLKAVKDTGRKYGFESVCYGHAGDGNLHVNILKGDLSEAIWKDTIPGEAIPELFRACIALGGTLSGEHGIGLVQRPYMELKFTERELELMKQIKKVFDPEGILNPGKIFI